MNRQRQRVTRLATAALGTILCLVPAAGVQSKTSVSFMAWTTCAEDIQLYKDLFAAFEKANPDMRIKNMNVAWAGEVAYAAKLMTMAAARVAPDVVMVPFMSLPRFAESGVLSPLDSYVVKDKLRMEDWQKAGVEAVNWKGNIWGLPTAGSDWWITYNKRLFAQTGLVDPEQTYEAGTWDWETMMSAAQKLSKFEGTKFQRIGLTHMGGIDYIAPWIFGMGGDFLSKDGLTCTVDSKTVVSTVEMLFDWIYVKRSLAMTWAPPYNIDLASGTKQEKWGMLAWWSSVATFVQSQKVSYTINQVPFPVGPASRDTNMAWFHSATMMKQTRDKAAAWKLIRFISGREASRIFGTNAWITSRKDSVSVYRDLTMKMGLTGNRFIEDAQDRMRASSRSVRFSTVWPKIDEELNKVWSQRSSSAQAMASAAKSATGELQRGVKKK